MFGIIHEDDERARIAAKEVYNYMKKETDVQLLKNKSKAIFDAIIAVGADSTVLRAFREFDVPVLGVNLGAVGFLTEISFLQYKPYIRRLLEKQFLIEERTRLEVITNGKKLPPALNEVNLSPKVTGSILRYTLSVDREHIWRDAADAIIVSTPTGSTGYNVSAGGPIVTEDSKVFVLTPICSLYQNRPIVASDKAEILIEEVSPNAEIIIDGRFRAKCSDKVVIRKYNKPAQFIRFEKHKFGHLVRKLKKGGRSVDEKLIALSPGAKLIYKTLTYESPLTQKEIVNETLLPPRTVRHCLKSLLDKDLITKQVSLKDTRQILYAAMRR